jgi:signal peptidase I
MLISFAVMLGGALIVLVFLRATGLVRFYRMPSSSMEPTLHCARPGSECQAGSDDRFLVVKYIFRSPKRGDLVVFHTPPLAEARCGAGGTFVKRLIGLPGETWEERDGYVYINGKLLKEPYVTSDRRDSRTIAPIKIAPGHYFLMGDNRVSSCDSRAWGTAPNRNLIGHLVAIYWPANRAPWL